MLSKWQQCVVEKQGLYILQPRGKLQKRATFVQTDGWTDGRTNKGFFTKIVGRDREPTVLQQVLQSIPLVKSPLFSTSKTSQDATTSCKADAREAITSSCDKMSRDAVRDRTVEQYDYRRTMALRTMALRTTWCKGSFKKRRPAGSMPYRPTGSFNDDARCLKTRILREWRERKNDEHVPCLKCIKTRWH